MLKQQKSNLTSQRPVLILNLDNDLQSFASELIKLDWQPKMTKNLSQASDIIQQSNLYVAIAIITTNTGNNIFSAIAELQHTAPHVKWLAIAMHYPINSADYSQNLATYFVDYFHWPIDWEQFIHTLGHVWGMTQLHKDTHIQQLSHLQSHTMVGLSNKIKVLKHKLKKVASSDCPVLISGETGTGKGFCAQLIHSISDRNTGPLITVNCGALPASLIHSELFGYEKGAFTGAERQHIGHIERAHNGTLFLDEIGDLPLGLQVNLLQFLDDFTIQRVGSNLPVKVDCRIVFASNIDLENAVAEGNFREDLFHRLNILRIHVPSLRHHREDIESLARDYLKQYSHSNNKVCFTEAALQSMLLYDWPGNVRELKNRILRAVVMAESDQITAEELGINGKSNFKLFSGQRNKQAEIDTDQLLDVIKQNNYNISAASRQLHISRTTCYRLIKKCKIKI